MVVLTTIGRRSGEPRDAPLFALRDGGTFLLIGTHGGEEKLPDWVANLRMRADATLQVGREHLAVEAREPEPGGDEYRSLWARAVAAYPGYAEYRARRSSDPPIVILDPRDDARTRWSGYGARWTDSMTCSSSASPASVVCPGWYAAEDDEPRSVDVEDLQLVDFARAHAIGSLSGRPCPQAGVAELAQTWTLGRRQLEPLALEPIEGHGDRVCRLEATQVRDRRHQLLDGRSDRRIEQCARRIARIGHDVVDDQEADRPDAVDTPSSREPRPHENQPSGTSTKMWTGNGSSTT